MHAAFSYDRRDPYSRLPIDTPPHQPVDPITSVNNVSSEHNVSKKNKSFTTSQSPQKKRWSQFFLSKSLFAWEEAPKSLSLCHKNYLNTQESNQDKFFILDHEYSKILMPIIQFFFFLRDIRRNISHFYYFVFNFCSKKNSL